MTSFLIGWCPLFIQSHCYRQSVVCSGLTGKKIIFLAIIEIRQEQEKQNLPLITVWMYQKNADICRGMIMLWVRLCYHCRQLVSRTCIALISQLSSLFCFSTMNCYHWSNKVNLKTLSTVIQPTIWYVIKWREWGWGFQISAVCASKSLMFSQSFEHHHHKLLIYFWKDLSESSWLYCLGKLVFTFCAFHWLNSCFDKFPLFHTLNKNSLTHWGTRGDEG